MIFFKNNPFIRLLIPLIIGIILQYLLLLNETTIVLLFMVVFITVLLSFFIKYSYQHQYIKGVAITFFLISCGLLVTHLTGSKNTLIGHANTVLLIGKVVKIPVERENNYKTEINIEAQKEGNHWKEISTKVIAYIEKEENICKIKAGSKIVFSAGLNCISPKKNPFGFDYAKYLSLKQIDNTVYLKNKEWFLLTEEGKGLRNSALNFRQKIIGIYDDHGIKGDNLAVLSALTLGYKNKLDAKVRKAYSGAGAMHVLAVSGLHVGIIFIVLQFFLGWISIFKRLKRAKFIIIIAALWGYAFITGLSPSVMRATVMFTFILAGRLFNKTINIYNSIAASAFLLLLINPYLLFEVSFQLSYVAVTGIVFFHSKIKGLLYFKFKPFNIVWSLIAVSVAAQLVTFPITIYHFHQFPLYFWLTNIFITISVAILIFLSVLLIILSVFPVISNFISVVINFLLHSNSVFIQTINNLPYATINHISFSSMQVLTIYVLIISFTIWFITKNFTVLITALFCILGLSIFNISNFFNRNNQSAVCVYQLQSESAIQFIHKKQSLWLLSSNSKNARINTHIIDGNLYWNTSSNSYFLLNNLNDSIIKNDNWYFNSGFWKTKQLSGLIIHSNSKLPQNPKDSLFINYLFVTGNPSFTFNDLPANLIFDNIIIDGSVPHWKAKQFVLGKGGANLFMTKEQGAFIVNEDLQPL